jgi:hypothetical protein
MKRLLAPASLALAAIFGAQPVAAAQPTPASGETWAPNQRVAYRWKASAEPPSWAKAAMNGAASDSNASRKAKAAIFSYDSDAASWLAYTDDIPTNWAIGYTIRNIPDSFTIRMRPHGTQLDWGTLRWCEFYDDPPNGCYDLEMVTLHEFGHAQTLNHANEDEIDAYTDTVMHAAGLHSKAKNGWNQHVFGRCDVARLQIRYEPLTTNTKISTCLDLGTDLSLSPASAAAASGSAVSFTARLKIAPDAVYPNLAGEALSGRSVVLQRRAPTDSTWVTVADMSAVTDDTGRYVKTITVSATYDWRAVFRTPDDEGLRASNSAASRITVSSGSGCSASMIGEAPAADTC